MENLFDLGLILWNWSEYLALVAYKKTISRIYQQGGVQLPPMPSHPPPPLKFYANVSEIGYK